MYLLDTMKQTSSHDLPSLDYDTITVFYISHVKHFRFNFSLQYRKCCSWLLVSNTNLHASYTPLHVIQRKLLNETFCTYKLLRFNIYRSTCFQLNYYMLLTLYKYYENAILCFLNNKNILLTIWMCQLYIF